jgi:hypothetical protein
MRERRAKGWIRLSAWVFVVGVVWMVVLPTVGSQSGVRSSIQFLREREIDPSAMFYTDLEALPDLQSDLDRIRREQPRAFWLPRDRDSRMAGS